MESSEEKLRRTTNEFCCVPLAARVNAGLHVREPGSATTGRPPSDHLGEAVIYWKFGLNSQESLLVQESSHHPGRRLWASLSQLAKLWRVPAKVWDSVTETAVGQLHSQTVVSVFVHSNYLSFQWRECVREKLYVQVGALVFWSHLFKNIFLHCVYFTCPCRSGCPVPVWLFQSAESSDCD